MSKGHELEVASLEFNKHCSNCIHLLKSVDLDKPYPTVFCDKPCFYEPKKEVNKT